MIKVLYLFWITSLASELEYRLNVIVEFISLFGNLSGSIFTLYLLYSQGSNLGGWDFYSSLIIIGIYTVLEAITISLLQPNLSLIVRHVQNGTLDFVLLKPIDSQLWLSFRVLSPWGIPSILIGILLIIFGLFKSDTV